MGRGHIAAQSDKAIAMKGIDTWKDYAANQFQGYNYVPNIALSVYRPSASKLMANPRDGGWRITTS
jgi:hypothetical protein